MRCLQCGVEMALLKKLRNSTEFCSEDCRQKYQDESNQMAVSRLMQQRKPKPVRAASALNRSQGSAKGATAVLAVSEPPLAEFLPQIALAELSAHPVSGPTDWQIQKGREVLPSLSDEVLTSLVALEFAHLGESYLPKKPKVAAIETLLPLQLPALWPVQVEGQPLPVYGPAGASLWEANWPEHWSEYLVLAEAAETAAASEVEAETTQRIETPLPDRAQPERLALPSVQRRDLDPIAILKTARPEVVHMNAETAAPKEAIALPEVKLETPAATLLPLRPRFAFAPKEPTPDKGAPQKEAPIKEAQAPAAPQSTESKKVILSKPAELNKVSAAPASPAPRAATKAEAPKVREAKIPDVRLEARRTDKPEASTTAHQTTSPSEPKEKDVATVAKPTVPPAPATEAPVVKAPSFGAPPSSSAATGLWYRMPWWEKCAAVAVFLLSIGGWLINGRPADDKKPNRTMNLPSPAASAPGMGADSWSTEWATDLAGAARGRQLTIYRPSKTMKDYVIDFQGSIQERSVGWIVRGSDLKNYYCLKLEKDPAGKFKLVRFAVVDGREDVHTQLPLSMLPAAEVGVFKIRAEVKGPKISTYVNGQAIDVWVDQRLTQGAAGFSNERGERAVVKSVKVSF
jgi:hypothetical protein